MTGVKAAALPDRALLTHYREAGAYTDCYAIEVNGAVSHSDFMHAFYTSWLFRIERWILGWAVAKPSTDADADALAYMSAEKFAAWTVETRTEDQILMRDYQGRTRSWLMTETLPRNRTLLYFGSAVVPRKPNGDPDRAFGTAFRLLLGFHKIYSRALLLAARNNLQIASKPAA